MSEDTDQLDRLIVTVTSVRRKFGIRLYRSAIRAARQAVAAIVLKEAERRAQDVGPRLGNVIQFPGRQSPSHPSERSDQD